MSTVRFQDLKLTRKAPLLEDITIQYSSIPFNGSFMKENIYRLKGSPEVDAAWEALGVNCKSSPLKCIAHAHILQTDQSESRLSVQKKLVFEVTTFSSIRSMVADTRPTSKAYITSTAWSVPCIHRPVPSRADLKQNLVRQGLWFNYDYYSQLGLGAFKNNDEVVRLHVSKSYPTTKPQVCSCFGHPDVRLTVISFSTLLGYHTPTTDVHRRCRRVRPGLVPGRTRRCASRFR